MKVRVLNQPFRDRNANMVKRRPGEIYDEPDKKRAEKLIKEGFVQEWTGPVRRGQAKQQKPAPETKEFKAPKIEGETK